MFKLLGIFTFLLVLSPDLAENSNGGECSRFPCDHEIVKKIVEIEHDHEVMKYLLSRYQHLEDTDLETAKIQEYQAALIQSLQTEVQHNRKEMKAKTDKQELAITTNRGRIERYNESLNERLGMCSCDIVGLQEELKTQREQIEKLSVKYENVKAEVDACHRARDCEDILAAHKSASSGVYTIYPDLRNFKEPSLSVYCDMSTQGGGWIVVQRRQDGSEDFYRGWQDYKTGFGNLSTEFWLGLENIHTLVSDGKWVLLVNMRDDVKGEKYAMYNAFSIASETEGYALTIGDYSGDAGDSISKSYNGMKFSTKDKDNDIHKSINCASHYPGAWWFIQCGGTNLNGVYGATGGKGPTWWKLAGYEPLEFVEIKMRKF